MRKTILIPALTALTIVGLASCKHEVVEPEVPESVAEETYAGGKLGTTFNQSASAFEDPTPAVENAGMVNAFKYGEFFFEHTVTQNNPPFNGLGPLYVRSSCEACHPGYGHGRRMERYRADDWANGYLLVVYNKTTDAYETSVAGMPQTKAVAPFKPSIDESKINIAWLDYVDEWGNRFPDGETYSLIYPEVTIPEDAFYAPLTAPYSQMAFRLESTIGIYGTGLLDAIPDDSLKAQYQKESEAGANLNPAIWAGNDWASLYGNTTHPKRFTYALSRGPLQDAAGANAIWNITNVSRPDRPFLYTTQAWATAMSQNAEVIARIRAQGADSPYYVDVDGNGTVTDAEIAEAVLALLSPKTNQFDNAYHNFEPEMSADEFYDFMVWHRGLAIPRARNLNDPDVQKGKELFTELGCANCHRPSWTTGNDNYWSPAMNGNKPLPRYANQTIWPYSDFIQHRLWMKNDIHGTWCRTTPLWGRGLSTLNTGRSDRLHDCRARNVVEAIMWHGYSSNSDAYRTVEKFYNLSKEERDAVVKFIESI